MVKKLLPVILGLVLAGGGFFAYNMFFAGGPAPEPPVQAQAKAKTALITTKKQRLKDRLEGPLVSAGDAFIVNLADAGVGSYVKTDVSIRVDKDTPMEPAGAEATGPPKLEEGTEVRNIIIDVLNAHSSSDLSTVDGRDKAKGEIVEEINNLKGTTPKTVALEVFFANFAIQAIPGG
jgi:flagellar FliL protein